MALYSSTSKRGFTGWLDDWRLWERGRERQHDRLSHWQSKCLWRGLYWTDGIGLSRLSICRRRQGEVTSPNASAGNIPRWGRGALRVRLLCQLGHIRQHFQAARNPGWTTLAVHALLPSSLFRLHPCCPPSTLERRRLGLASFRRRSLPHFNRRRRGQNLVDLVMRRRNMPSNRVVSCKPIRREEVSDVNTFKPSDQIKVLLEGGPIAFSMNEGRTSRGRNLCLAIFRNEDNRISSRQQLCEVRWRHYPVRVLAASHGKASLRVQLVPCDDI